MKEKEAKPTSLWIDVIHIDMPRTHWIWWVIEGTPDAPGAGSRSFSSLHAMQEHVRERGYNPPTASQINEAVLQARVDNKDEVTLKVSPK
ncbi:hypothetical protein [Candidatus Nitronereus thalassa]|uniref:Uncharacterized protein n=1 Tax=Candidatus Nitronereus thalassa TaxID=3020898 RepID=A0ABU3K8M9_9BACT|nr:hypothetical protein [Candidatus Nitronereus thalassa]MDT7042755.1 hypothetical protein [Candidatus Nitronereus thalassa]